MRNKVIADQVVGSSSGIASKSYVNDEDTQVKIKYLQTNLSNKTFSRKQVSQLVVGLVLLHEGADFKQLRDKLKIIWLFATTDKYKSFLVEKSKQLTIAEKSIYNIKINKISEDIENKKAFLKLFIIP